MVVVMVYAFTSEYKHRLPRPLAASFSSHSRTCIRKGHKGYDIIHEECYPTNRMHNKKLGSFTIKLDGDLCGYVNTKIVGG